MAFVRDSYEVGKAHGEPLIGFFPEWNNGATAEACEIADMIGVALRLSQAGIGDYWDDVDRYVRNQFAESQLLRADWINRHAEGLERGPVPDAPAALTDQVAERNIGAFAGWASVNDFCPNATAILMHCCLGNAARTLYYVWKSILEYANGALRVNLLLNRASRWADVDSYIPYEGRVDIKLKTDCKLEVRIPEWVQPEQTVCTVNGSLRRLSFQGRYAQAGDVHLRDVVAITFPIFERTVKATIGAGDYTLVLKGNEVVAIDPPGKLCPLYLRPHYRENRVRWVRRERFAPAEEINW